MKTQGRSQSAWEKVKHDGCERFTYVTLGHLAFEFTNTFHVELHFEIRLESILMSPDTGVSSFQNHSSK